MKIFFCIKSSFSYLSLAATWSSVLSCVTLTSLLSTPGSRGESRPSRAALAGSLEEEEEEEEGESRPSRAALADSLPATQYYTGQ